MEKVTLNSLKKSYTAFATRFENLLHYEKKRANLTTESTGKSFTVCPRKIKFVKQLVKWHGECAELPNRLLLHSCYKVSNQIAVCDEISILLAEFCFWLKVSKSK